MQSVQQAEVDGALHVENIGGIDQSSITFSPGVNILVGRNATNRTSLLHAIRAACGSDDVSIKADAEEAYVELSIGEESYSRDFYRRSGSVISEGNGYLTDAKLADLFAFLLESNEARRAVATGANLREIIMRPVDTEAIQSQIENLVTTRKDLETQLEEIEQLKGDLPALEEKRTQLRDEIESKRSQLAQTEEKVESLDESIEETKEERDRLDERMDALSSKRATLDDIRYSLETERETLETLQNEQRNLQERLEGLPAQSTGEVAEFDQRLEDLRSEKQSLETNVNELQSVIGFNEEMLEDTDSQLLAVLKDQGSGDVTDQLLDEEIVCWTCGSEVQKDEITATLEQLRSLSQDQISKISDLETEINELVESRKELEQAQEERTHIEDRLREIEAEIERNEDEIRRLKDRRSELMEDIEDLEKEVESMDDADFSGILDLHKEANQFEYEIGKLENELESVTEEMARIESRIEEQERIEDRLEGVRSEITEYRTKIDRIEERAVEEFNQQMDDVLDLLDYTNLDRIWIERIDPEKDDRPTGTHNVFDLHVIRTTESGTAYEDTVDHLSESEREVTGLIFALAGYLAHEVYEEVPFMLLDSLEAIDAERIGSLVVFLREFTPYLFVALLPEDAQALDESFNRLTEI